MAVIVGDIHGNVEKVKAFLDYKPEAVHVALGDYLDSFTEPVSRQIEALQLLLDSDALLLWGNHDLHYADNAPWLCTGYNYDQWESLCDIVNKHRERFLAAHAVDGYLLTHAGCHVRLAKHQTNVYAIASRFNDSIREWLHDGKWRTMFDIGKGRGGYERCGGIFWFDFKRETGLAPVPQIFGHTETKKPIVKDNYVALDTTNNSNTCFLFDTETNEIVELKLPMRIKPVLDIDFGDDDIITAENIGQEQIEEYRAGLRVNKDVQQAEEALERYHRGEETAIALDELIRINLILRISDLLPDEQEPFKTWLQNSCRSRPVIEGVGPDGQDGYWPTDYKEWRNALIRNPRISNLPLDEQGPFTEWLMGKTRPSVPGDTLQDFYYESDYQRWKAGRCRS